MPFCRAWHGRRLNDEGVVEKISVRKLFGDKKGVLVGVPGAFTPTCSNVHLPEFVEKSGALAAKVIRQAPPLPSCRD